MSIEPKFLSFNTGRMYQKDGQQIYAVGFQGFVVSDAYDDGWRVIMLDISRGILAEFSLVPGFTEEAIMKAYDKGGYSYPSQSSIEFSMLLDHFSLRDTRWAD